MRRFEPLWGLTLALLGIAAFIVLLLVTAAVTRLRGALR